jgi:hypothetical protein
MGHPALWVHSATLREGARPLGSGPALAARDGAPGASGVTLAAVATWGQPLIAVAAALFAVAVWEGCSGRRP